MNHIIPPSLLFEFQIAIPMCPAPSRRKTGRLLKLPEAAHLFTPSSMNGIPTFARISVGWNEDGIGLSVTVRDKYESPKGDSKATDRSDCLLVWLDTRPTGDVHRATEYCHSFACLPVDEQMDGMPGIVVQPIAQQRAKRMDSNTKKVLRRTHLNKDGYELEVWFPCDQLYGYREITELGRIGFHCVVQDSQLGEQPFSVGDDFPTTYDPSTWTQLELQS